MMIRASYQKRLSALILGIRPTTAHIYGSNERFSVDNLTPDGRAAWTAGIQMISSNLSAAEELSITEQWVSDWVNTELVRDQTRWDDASSMLELLALSLGPVSLDPSHLRPDWFWAKWMRNLEALRFDLDSGRASLSGDSIDLTRHCSQLVSDHGGPDAMSAILAGIELCGLPVRHQPEVFRPLSTPVERLQLSAVIASAYAPPTAREDCTAKVGRLFEYRPDARETCSRVPT